MANHASRLAKLEQQTNNGASRFVWMNEGETNEGAWQRYLASADVDAVAAIKAREAGRVIFFSWTDSKL